MTNHSVSSISDIIYVSRVSNHQQLDCSLVCLGLQRKHAKPVLLALCERNPLVTGGFPSQKATNAESLFLSWHHHDNMYWTKIPTRTIKCLHPSCLIEFSPEMELYLFCKIFTTDSAHLTRECNVRHLFYLTTASYMQNHAILQPWMIQGQGQGQPCSDGCSSVSDTGASITEGLTSIGYATLVAIAGDTILVLCHVVLVTATHLMLRQP